MSDFEKALQSIYDFLNEFCPYEADEVIEEWEQGLQENPTLTLEQLEEYEEDAMLEQDLAPLYDKMYDAVNEYILSVE